MKASGRRRWLRYIVVAVAALAVSLLAAMAAFEWATDTGPRRPRSDVRIVWEVEAAPDFERLRITGLTARVIDARMNLFNGIGLIGFRLQGQMTGPPGARPRLDRVQLAERVIIPRTAQVDPAFGGRANEQVGTSEAALARPRPLVELEVTPLLGRENDETYEGEAVSFSVNVEKWVHAIQWGSNRYAIRCAGIERELVLIRAK
jgi:hypothetical protein